MTKKLMVDNPGFTIVELITTIIIIGILTTIGVISYNGVQVRTRDDRREVDVSSIMDRLEDYYRKNGDYPANDSLNPSSQYPTMTDFSAAKTLMPGLSNAMLTEDGGYSFWPACINSGWCINGSGDWHYKEKQYVYLSRFSNGVPGQYWYYNVPASWDNNKGWGCSVQTYYTNPGYAIAWYSESKKLWIFKRSQYGQVDIANYSTGPIAPQTCTFS